MQSNDLVLVPASAWEEDPPYTIDSANAQVAKANSGAVQSRGDRDFLVALDGRRTGGVSAGF